MKFQVIVLFVAVSLSYGLPRPKSAIRLLDGRIVGGDPVDISEYPHQLSLASFGSHICGASIINENYALTAAHCTDGSSPQSLSVRAGSSIKNSGGTQIGVRRIIQNKDFDWGTIDFDASVLELDGPLPIGDNVQPIALQEAGEKVAAGTEVVVTGWGTLSSGGSSPRQLQAVALDIVDHDKCQENYNQENITDRMLCAGVIGGGKDACQGDSGGPLINKKTGKQVGIVSWGYGCADPDYPGIFSDVSSMREFIDAAVKN